MTDEHEIRATSDHMIDLIDRLRMIEHEKRESTLGSEGFVTLAREAERVSRLVFRWSGLQLQLATESTTAVDHGRLQATPIVRIEPRRLDRVLALWREAQFRLEIARPGSPEAAAAADELERLRVEYHATTDSKLAEDDDAAWSAETG